MPTLKPNSAMPRKILIDLNVLLDVLQARAPHAKASAAILAAAEQGAIEGWIAAHSVTTLYYLYAKSHSPAAARRSLVGLLGFLHVAPVDENVLKQALGLPYSDFEDAVQMASALAVGAACIVSRNVKDFRLGPLPVHSPAECLPLLRIASE